MTKSLPTHPHMPPRKTPPRPPCLHTSRHFTHPPVLLSDPSTARSCLTPRYLPLPHPTSATTAPGARLSKKARTWGHRTAATNTQRQATPLPTCLRRHKQSCPVAAAAWDDQVTTERAAPQTQQGARLGAHGTPTAAQQRVSNLVRACSHDACRVLGAPHLQVHTCATNHSTAGQAVHPKTRVPWATQQSVLRRSVRRWRHTPATAYTHTHSEAARQVQHTHTQQQCERCRHSTAARPQQSVSQSV